MVEQGDAIFADPHMKEQNHYDLMKYDLVWEGSRNVLHTADRRSGVLGADSLEMEVMGEEEEKEKNK